MIYKFCPFATDKKIFGKEINGHCALVPGDDDWILITDYDVLFLIPETFKVIETALERYPDTTIFGAMTNRVGYFNQRVGVELSLDDRVAYHIGIAMELAERYKDGECKDAMILAGFFMLFKKAYWNKVKFRDKIVDENDKNFDGHFCKPAQLDGKMRIILGAYVFHTYRLLKDPYDKSHLI